MKLSDVVPNVDVLLELKPEELAGALLSVLRSGPGRNRPYEFTYFMFEGPAPEYPQERRNDVGRAILEAWGWLQTQGLIAPAHNPSGPPEFFVTRLGRSIGSPDEFEAYRKAAVLQKGVLHPAIADKVWINFLRGDHDTAVFQAFKEVEVSVRAAGGFPDTKIGVGLMRDAFHPQSGPLSDTALPVAEREALQHLFAGAIGSYKNPQSHRTVALTDPIETAEMIMIASHLLRIVDARKGTVSVSP